MKNPDPPKTSNPLARVAQPGPRAGPVRPASPDDLSGMDAMTRIEFHFHIPERLRYTCRLLRKARAQDLRVAVVGASATLRQSFQSSSFCRESSAK